jgi:hypothetical protein
MGEEERDSEELSCGSHAPCFRLSSPEANAKTELGGLVICTWKGSGGQKGEL